MHNNNKALQISKGLCYWFNGADGLSRQFRSWPGVWALCAAPQVDCFQAAQGGFAPECCFLPGVIGCWQESD